MKIKKEENTKKTVGYARVSSPEQAENSHALEQQEARLKEAGATQIFTDIESGSKDDRPKLNQLINDIKNREFDCLIATRIDRLARSLPKLIELVDLCLEFDVNVIILDQNIDLKTSQGKFMLHLLGSLAEFETDMLSSRVKHGFEYRRKQQKAPGSYPWGYQVINDKYQLNITPFLCLIEQRPDNYLELANPEVPIENLPGLTIAEIGSDFVLTFQKKKGLSRTVKTIYGKYGILKCSTKKNGNDGILNFTASSLKKWLTNPVLQGHTVYNKKKTVAKNKTIATDPSEWQIIKHTHPDDVLVSPEELIEIERILEFNRKTKPPTYNSNTQEYDEFSYQNGLVFCSECGSKCITKTRQSKDGQTKYKYFACRHAKMGCQNIKSVKKELIELELLKELLSKQNTNEESLDMDVVEASSHLIQLEENLAHLMASPYFNQQIEEIKRELLQEIELEKNPFRLENLQLKTVAELMNLGNNFALWYSLSFQEKHDIYPRLVKRINVNHGAVVSIELNV